MWRGTLTYNKYISVAARATRQALKEDERLKADSRSTISLRYQEYKDGKGGAQTWIVPPVEEK